MGMLHYLLMRKSYARDAARRRTVSTNGGKKYKSTKSHRHESTSKSKSKSKNRNHVAQHTMRRTKANTEDDDVEYPDTTDSDDDSDDNSRDPATKVNDMDKQSAVHTIHVRRSKLQNCPEPRLVELKRFERRCSSLDTDEANLIFQPEPDPGSVKVMPDTHEVAEHTKKTRPKKRFSFFHMTGRKERNVQSKKTVRRVSPIQAPNGYTVDKEDGRKAIPLRIIHTESRNNTASFFHLFASTRSWGQLRTMLKIIPEPELRRTIKEVGQLKSLKAKQQNALHLLCKVDPPFDIVKRIIEIYPKLAKQKDIHGHFPLHTVVARGITSLSVLEIIIDRYIFAMEKCDNKGMTPLMLACRDMSPNDEKVAVYLLGSWPSVIHVEDENKMNAMEFARLSGCSLLVMIHLRQIAEGMSLYA
jgi:hypothetical protein